MGGALGRSALTAQFADVHRWAYERRCGTSREDRAGVLDVALPCSVAREGGRRMCSWMSVVRVCAGAYLAQVDALTCERRLIESV